NAIARARSVPHQGMLHSSCAMFVGSVLFAQAYVEGSDQAAEEPANPAALIEEAIKEAEEDLPAR
ncbi:MAG: hypothetical protein ACK2T7_01400, partial [Anaerolineales bacterium]